MQLLAQGLTYKQIAYRRQRSLSTIRTQVHNVIGRLGVSTSAQAVIECASRGWLELRDATATIELVAIHGLAADVRELTEAVRANATRGLNPQQRRFLNAFEDHIFARSDEERHATYARLDQTVTAMLARTAVTRPIRTDRTRDIVELIARAARS